jgi:hypothetical protein
MGHLNKAVQTPENENYLSLFYLSSPHCRAVSVICPKRPIGEYGCPFPGCINIKSNNPFI